MEGVIGEIRLFGGSFAPREWAYCQGQLMSISQNTALFSILGTTYGGDGRTTFALPDMRGRAMLHPGTGPGLTTRVLGQRFGTESNTMTILDLPPHTHAVIQAPTAQVSATIPASVTGNSGSPAGALPASGKDVNEDEVLLYSSQASNASLSPLSAQIMGSAQTSITGTNQSTNNMQPATVVDFIICLYGIYPSRN